MFNINILNSGKVGDIVYEGALVTQITNTETGMKSTWVKITNAINKDNSVSFDTFKLYLIAQDRPLGGVLFEIKPEILDKNESYIELIKMWSNEIEKFHHIGSALHEVVVRIMCVLDCKRITLMAIQGSDGFHNRFGYRFRDEHSGKYQYRFGHRFEKLLDQYGNAKHLNQDTEEWIEKIKANENYDDMLKIAKIKLGKEVDDFELVLNNGCTASKNDILDRIFKYPEGPQYPNFENKRINRKKVDLGGGQMELSEEAINQWKKKIASETKI